MQIYSAKIRLGGLLHNEVRKDELTAPEILVLRGIHGADALVDIKPILNADGTPYDVKRNSKSERTRLLTIYREDQFRKIFPTDFTPLPQTLVEVDEDEMEEADELEGIEAVDEAIKPKSGLKGGTRPVQENIAKKAAREAATAESALA